MKTCESIGGLLLLVETGEASPAECRLVESHLAVCPACQTLMQAQTRVMSLAKAVSSSASPQLDILLLEDRARRKPVILRWPILTAAALALALAGGVLWLSEGVDRKSGIPRTALLDEWQFWLVSTVGHLNEIQAETPFLTNWNERDFARHLLVLEGLMPEEDYAAEDESQDATNGGLPPISLRDCSNPAPLRS